MSFLQPWMLLAMPIVALPVIIHLINQRRYQTMPWAAMMFLLAANRMSRGYARLRQWLILAFRMLAIAGLLFVISRPLASGWLGATAGGAADTTLVLLDRSPSMQQIGDGTASSKLDTARQQLVAALSTLQSARLVLIDSGDGQVRELESIDDLAEAPDTAAADNTADLAGMLQEAYDYVKANRVGRADIWIVSDLRESDWNSDSGRWAAIRDAFKELPQTTKINLLAYGDPAPDNLSLRVTDVRRQTRGDQTNLLVSLRIRGGSETVEARKIPLQFEIDGARSEWSVSLSGGNAELKDHPIPIDDKLQRGWGRVSIPADANPADNDAYFVFDDPPPRKTILVADEPQAARPLQLAAEIASDPNVPHRAEQVPRSQLGTVAWEEVSLLLWQGELPSDEERPQVESFVKAGGQVIFFPPRNPSDAQMFGIRWRPWNQAEQAVAVAQWRGDQDLLANTLSGSALPVGQLRISNYAGIEGPFIPLASLDGDRPLLVRAAPPNANQPTASADHDAASDGAADNAAANDDNDTSDDGDSGPLGVYFCTTTPSPLDSSLARDGVVLYVAIQRAVRKGAAALSDTRTLIAGTVQAENWRAVSTTDDAISSEYGIHQGVYRTDEQLVAVNRSVAEDATAMVSDAKLQTLFGGLDFSRVDDTAGNLHSLVQEIWRLFLVLMVVAMIVEAALCLPRRRSVTES
ncbi:BatA domain-containing protein [Roseimaritima ulvae]|uniref:Aerotolerance regulator N-terminal domain-containing protein n=1 Tax=Roseimaritima ulvae TaxID=980254 RepID=A0A5B9QXB1_9BACT|nr:BatA domain-containing protein [Roseimaritima ulvae]QEG38593.1 hypothetical protein UC8_05500 [Roseimaritima ulvae]